MKSTSAYFSVARKAVADEMDALPLSEEEKRRLSKSIAKFAAAAVREDRVHRHPHDSLAKLVDVFFNRRPA